MASALSLLLTLLIFFIPSLCCPEDKKQALLQFKSSLIKTTSSLSLESRLIDLESWNSSSDCCNWDRVICSTRFHSRTVIALYLDNLISMQSIEPIVVTSTILTPLFRIRSLMLLDMAGNQIQGELPGFANLSKLVYLDMSSNSFHGILTREVGSLQNLRVLSCWLKITFQGKFLTLISNIYRLQLLSSNSNRFFGNLPDFSSNVFLGYIDISSNEFSGEIPTKFYQVIEILALGKIRFTGNFPRNLTNMSHHEHLDIHDNKISGELLEFISQISTLLQVLNLRNTTFQGSIPDGISNLSCLRILDLSSNHLVGNIPAKFGNLLGMIEKPNESFSSLSNIFTISLKYNDLIVNWKKSKQGLSSHNLELYSLLDLSMNQLFGEIPASLGRLNGLKLLNISLNILHGN